MAGIACMVLACLVPLLFVSGTWLWESWSRGRRRWQRAPGLPEAAPQTPEEKAAFLRECEDVYLQSSDAGHCQWHGTFKAERTPCCIHQKILTRRGGGQ